jgi:hypothetical protein
MPCLPLGADALPTSRSRCPSSTSSGALPSCLPGPTPECIEWFLVAVTCVSPERPGLHSEWDWDRTQRCWQGAKVCVQQPLHRMEHGILVAVVRLRAQATTWATMIDVGESQSVRSPWSPPARPRATWCVSSEPVRTSRNGNR